MDDARDANRTIDWWQQFLWPHIFRVFRIAIDPRKMLLAGLGLLALAAGDWVSERLPFALADASHQTEWPWGQSTETNRPLDSTSDVAEIVQSVSINSRSIVQPMVDFI